MLFPLATHGGPLWQPLCYAQIGGLAVATFITLLLMPVFYSIAVLDLKIVKWTVQLSEGPPVMPRKKCAHCMQIYAPMPLMRFISPVHLESGFLL